MGMALTFVLIKFNVTPVQIIRRFVVSADGLQVRTNCRV